MPRQATEKGKAIRKLFAQTKGEITYLEAREHLQKAGFELPEEDTTEGSPYRNDMNSFNVAKYHWKKTNLGDKSIRPRGQKAKKAKEAGKRPVGRPRKHPVEVKAKPKFGHTAKPKHAPKIVHEGDINESLALVAKQGGLKACREQVAELRAQADALEAHVETVVSFQQRLEKVA